MDTSVFPLFSIPSALTFIISCQVTLLPSNSLHCILHPADRVASLCHIFPQLPIPLSIQAMLPRAAYQVLSQHRSLIFSNTHCFPKLEASASFQVVAGPFPLPWNFLPYLQSFRPGILYSTPKTQFRPPLYGSFLDLSPTSTASSIQGYPGISGTSELL